MDKNHQDIMEILEISYTGLLCLFVLRHGDLICTHFFGDLTKHDRPSLWHYFQTNPPKWGYT